MSYLLRWYVKRHSSQVDFGVSIGTRQYEKQTWQQAKTRKNILLSLMVQEDKTNNHHRHSYMRTTGWLDYCFGNLYSPT